MNIDASSAETYAGWFACLADPTRIRILNAIAIARHPATVHELVEATGVSQSTVSHHLRLLADNRFVFLERRGAATECTLNARCLERFPAAASEVLGMDGWDPPAKPRRRPRSVVDEPIPTIRSARQDDLRLIKGLLIAHDLPLVGVAENLEETWVAEAGGRILGCSAIEFYGRNALLRSVAVASGHQRSGLGRRLVERALTDAAPLASRAYLLTETAAGFFRQLGFIDLDRSQVPASVRSSIEFTRACPTSAQAMTRALGAGQPPHAA